MNLKEILPTADELKLARGIEANLLERRRKGLIGGMVAISAAVAQVLLVAIEKNYPEKIGGAFRSVFGASRIPVSVPDLIGAAVIVIGLAIYFTLRWTSVLAKESKEPFQYTFWIEPFEETSGTPGERFALKAEDRLKLLNQDLMERLSRGIRRLSLLDAERDVPKEVRQSLTSHVQVRGTYAVREKKDHEWVLEVMARIRIGPLGRPETLVDPVTVSFEEYPTAKSEEVLTADRYNQVVERVYSKVATEIYKQILSDVNAKSDLFPSSYLRAVALFHEAVDFERSNTIDAYDHAIKLYRESKHYFDIRILGWIPRLLIRIPRVPFVPVWRLAKRPLLADANTRAGLARALIYRRVVSALAGRDQNELFEAPPELKRVITELSRLQHVMRREWRSRAADHGSENKRNEPGTIKSGSRYPTLMGFLTYPGDSALRRGRQDFDEVRRTLSSAHAVAALGYFYLGDSEAARNHLERAKAAEPVFTETNSVWFLASAETEPDPGKKLLFLRGASEFAPKFEIAQYRLAQVSEIKLRMRDEIRKGRVEGVIKQYDEVLAINPGNIGALWAEGYILWLSEELEDARKEFEEGCETKAIVRQAFIGDLFYGLARIAAEKGEINESYELYTQAIAAEPGVAAYSPPRSSSSKTIQSSYDYLSESMLSRYEMFRVKAEATIQKLMALPEGARRLDARKVDVSKRIITAVHSAVLNDHGNACLNYFIRFGDRKSLSTAISDYEDAVKLDPDNAVAYFNLHVAHGWGDDPPEERIKECLEKAEKLTPAWPEVLINLARTQLQQTRRKAEKLTADIAETEAKKKKAAEEESQQIEISEAVSSSGPGLTGKTSLASPDPDKLIGKTSPATPKPAKTEALNMQLTQLRKDLRSAQEMNAGSWKIAIKVINQTKWSSVPRDPHLSPQRVDELLADKIPTDRLNENDIGALELWANLLAYDETSREALLAAEKLCKYVQEFYPKRFDTIQILSSVYGYLEKLAGSGNDAQVEAYRRKRAECERELADTIRDWLRSDPIHFAALKWATEFTSVLPSEEQLLLLNQAVERSGRKYDAYHYLLGAFHYRAASYELAAESYETASEINPDEPIYLNLLGNSYFQTGKYHEAIGSYRKAIALPRNPQTGRYYSNLSRAYEELKDWEQAIRACKHAIRLDEKNTEYRVQLSNILNAEGNDYFAKSDFENARKHYEEAIGLAPENAVYQSNLALAYQGLRDGTRSIEAWKKALELDPKNTDYQHQMNNVEGNDCLVKADYQNAVTHYQKAIALAPTNAVYHANLALAYQGLKDWEKAIGTWKKVLELEPENTEYRHQMNNVEGNDYLLKREYQNAAKHYQEAIALAPENAVYHSNLALAYQGLGDQTQALAAWKKALEFDPENTEYRHQMNNVEGNDYLFKGDYQNAVTHYQEAIALAPENAVYHSNLALAYQGLGDQAQALTAWQKALDLDPENAEYGRQLKNAEGNQVPSVLRP